MLHAARHQPTLTGTFRLNNNVTMSYVRHGHTYIESFVPISRSLYGERYVLVFNTLTLLTWGFGWGVPFLFLGS